MGEGGLLIIVVCCSMRRKGCKCPKDRLPLKTKPKLVSQKRFRGPFFMGVGGFWFCGLAFTWDKFA